MIDLGSFETSGPSEGKLRSVGKYQNLVTPRIQSKHKEFLYLKMYSSTKIQQAPWACPI
jgi:hypothetical protein